MSFLGARVKRVFPPSWPVFLDGRPGRLLDWSIDPSVLLHYCLFHLMQRSFVILFFRFKRQSSHDLEDVGGIRGKFEDSRFLDILYSFLYTYPTQEWNPRKILFRQSSLDKRVAICTLDEEVNDDNIEDQKRVRPILIRGVLVKEESRDCQGQGQGQGQGHRNYRCQDAALPLSPGILVNGFPLWDWFSC